MVKLNQKEAYELFKKEELLYLKFVRVDGEYRFTDCGFSGCSHKDLVNEGEIATSAGFVKIRGYKLNDLECEGHSSTLKMSWQIGDEENLKKIFFPL